MKIGIDIRTLMDRHYSGVSEYTNNLVKNLLAQDRQNEYCLYYNSFQDLSARIPNFTQANVKVINTRYPNKLFNYGLQKLLAYPKIDKVLGGVDVFLAPHINFLSLSEKVKKVLTIHDLSFIRYPEFFSGRKNAWHQIINVKNLVHKFEQVVAVSENTKNDLVQLVGVNPDKVRVVYSGVNEKYRVTDIMSPEALAVKAKYELPDNFILYLGNIEPRKNIGSLIRAYNDLREKNPELGSCQLIIAGATGWKIQDTFRELNNSPYKEDIRFLGYIEKQDKLYLYNLATIFVYPSFYEGFGFPPLEAMASGLAVITSNVSSLPEIVGAAALTIDPYDVQALTTAMKQLLTDEDLREKYIARGLKQVKKFNWAQTARQYLDIFKSL